MKVLSNRNRPNDEVATMMRQPQLNNEENIPANNSIQKMVNQRIMARRSGEIGVKMIPKQTLKTMTKKLPVNMIRQKGPRKSGKIPVQGATTTDIF